MIRRFAFLVPLALWTWSASASPKITTFKLPHTQFTFAQTLNKAGAIAGTWSGKKNGAFVRMPDGTAIQFAAPHSFGTMASAIDKAGDVTGWALSRVDFQTHGYVRSADGKLKTFDPEGSTNTHTGGMNDHGTIVGYYADSQSHTHGYIRDAKGKITAIDAPGATSATYAVDVNKGGGVAGYYADAKTAHGYARDGSGTITAFDAPDADQSAGHGTTSVAINDAGAITGSYTDANGTQHGYIRAADSSITEFDAPDAGNGAGEGTTVTAINSKGAVVGWYMDASDLQHAFVRAPGGKITEFDVPHKNLYDTQAQAINDAGEITGYYCYLKNDTDYCPGFLRTP